MAREAHAPISHALAHAGACGRVEPSEFLNFFLKFLEKYFRNYCGKRFGKNKYVGIYFELLEGIIGEK